VEKVSVDEKYCTGYFEASGPIRGFSFGIQGSFTPTRGRKRQQREAKPPLSQTGTVLDLISPVVSSLPQNASDQISAVLVAARGDGRWCPWRTTWCPPLQGDT
jgi:hypothetical protein